ncbi:hypothetical protein MYXA107069_23965 [Myxococcus xanthus]|nr:hypothetical protein MyxoNM_19085 [Myxococcus xanthus]SDY36032.1 ELWxxDGT repeat-containing protein [Myxococcus xanthus]
MGSDPLELTRGNRLLFFTADDGVHSRELWRSTGTGGKQRWRKPATAQDGRFGPHTRPANRLSELERRRILAVANSKEFRDISPKQIVPRLADRGEYVASEASFYRVLREAGQLAHRGCA